MTGLLEVKNLKKYFPVTRGLFKKAVQHIRAVDGVSFTIGAGETFGLVGESGCGKTTVGKLVLRLREANEGELLFDGKDIRNLIGQELLHIRRNMQIIFQDPYGSLNPRMTVADILGEPMIKHRLVRRGAECGDRVRQLLGTVGLNIKDEYKYPHEFSGGQRQRIVIARALALNPKLIVCDEPVSALDVSIQAQILNLLQELQIRYGVAYLFIAHGMAVVKHISHKVGVMYLGKLVEIADSSIIFDRCVHPYTKALMSSIPIPDPVRHRNRIILQGELPNPINPPQGCKFHPRCRHAREQCRQEEPELREISGGHFTSCHFSNKIN
jgi:oligopeptide/dipeptide ABC transporter ATP-binding protein